MRKIIIIILFAKSALVPIQAQTIQDIGKIVLGVKIMPDATNETQALQSQLHTKIRQLATQAGYSSYGNNAFIIAPNIIVDNVDMAEGGMKNVYVVQGNLSLSIQTGHSGIVFANILLPFKGYATKKEPAIKNAILNIGYNDVGVLFDEAKSKILGYYEAQEDAIFARADTYIQNKEYDEAITCLMMVPAELFGLYEKALAKANEAYILRDEELHRQAASELRNQNDGVLIRARSLLAMHNPIEALKTLWNYQSGEDDQNQIYSSMIAQAEAMITSAEKAAIEKEREAYKDKKLSEDREWTIREKESEHRMAIERQQMEYDRAESIQELQLEQQRIDAIKTVACEYLKNNHDSDIYYY